jgi:hypothetical protein
MESTWTPDKMITPRRVAHVARALFADEFHDSDCHSEHGRVGLPCNVCAELNQAWQERLARVRRAMLDSFGYSSHA